MKREKGEEEQEEGRWGSLQLPELEASRQSGKDRHPCRSAAEGRGPGPGRGGCHGNPAPSWVWASSLPGGSTEAH